MTEKIGHRKVGSGATTIRIAPRIDTRDGGKNPGFRMFIGRRLWQDIGMPERVRLSGSAEGKWLIEASDAEESYKVSGPAQDTIPRIHVSKALIGSLGLSEGVYAAVSYPLRKLIVFTKQHS